MKKVLLIVLILFLLMSLAVVIILFSSDVKSPGGQIPGTDTSGRDNTATQNINTFLSLRAQPMQENEQDNQQDTQVEIDKVVMKNPGFVVLRQVISGNPGQIIEVSEYLPEGVHTPVIITLENTAAGSGDDGVRLGSEFPERRETVAVVYADDGDGGFNPSQDEPVYWNDQLIARSVTSGRIVSAREVLPEENNFPEVTADVTITYTNAGFEPRDVVISKGQRVEFINKSDSLMWVASDTHPAHDVLPSFDQFGTSGFDERYVYTFSKPGTWRYHDHVNASMTGVIMVE